MLEATLRDLEELAALLSERNRVAREITGLIHRPCQIGHVGEYIASRVFDIQLEESATSKAIDGRFASGPLRGRSVNVKWYAKREGILDITPDYLPELYLVLAGPKTASASSRGEVRPWLIDSVHLFEAEPVVARLRERGVKLGVATSLREAEWDQAEIYPRSTSPILQLSQHQRRALSLFGQGG